MAEFLSPQNVVSYKAKQPLVLPGLPSAICGLQGVLTWGPEDAPFPVTSAAELLEKGGPRNDTYPQVYDGTLRYLRNGGKTVYLNRTVTSSAAKATNTFQADAQNTGTLSGRYKGARGNTFGRKFTRTSAPAGTISGTVIAGSTTFFAVSAPSKFNVGDLVSFTTTAPDTKRGVISAVTASGFSVAVAIVVPVGGYDSTTTITIDSYTLDLYESASLAATYTGLQTSPLSPRNFAKIVSADSNRLIDAENYASPAPTFATNVDNRPATDATAVLLTAGSDGGVLTDTELKGSSSAFTGVWAWERARNVIFFSMPGVLGIGAVTVAVYKEAEVYERFRKTRSPVFFIADPPQGLSPSAMKTWWTTTLAASSSGMLTWYPWLMARDVATNLSTAIPPSPLVMGLIAKAHQAINIAQPPAGETYGDFIDVDGTDLTVPLQEGDARYDDLYQVGINCILLFEGVSAARALGNRTAAINTDLARLHVAIVFAIAQREIKRRTDFATFKTTGGNGTTLSLLQQIELAGRGLFRQWRTQSPPILAGRSDSEAFFIVCNDSNNTAVTKAKDKIINRMGLNIVSVGEVIEQTLELDTRALEAELFG